MSHCVTVSNCVQLCHCVPLSRLLKMDIQLPFPVAHYVLLTLCPIMSHKVPHCPVPSAVGCTQAGHIAVTMSHYPLSSVHTISHNIPKCHTVPHCPHFVTQCSTLTDCAGGLLSGLTGSYITSWTSQCCNVLLCPIVSQWPTLSIPQCPEMSHCAPLSPLCHTMFHTDPLCRWFAERADRILLLFDAHKLDISDEFKSAIDAIKGEGDKVKYIRLILLRQII